MDKPVLFLLAPGFEASIDLGSRREYCPECAEMWGVLSYFPAIKEAVDIRYETLAHPRTGLAALLGPGHHNCPTLVLPKGADIPKGVPTITVNGYNTLPNARGIGVYFHKLYGTPIPRGS